MKNIHGTAYTGHGKERNDTEQVRIIDFSRWLRATVVANDFVVVKMDIEGSEYEVLPSLLRTGTIRLIDELMLEVHYNRNSWESEDRSAYCSARRTAEMEAEGSACVHRDEAVRWIEHLRTLDSGSHTA